MSPIEYISYVRDINNIYLHVSMPFGYVCSILL